MTSASLETEVAKIQEVPTIARKITARMTTTFIVLFAMVSYLHFSVVVVYISFVLIFSYFLFLCIFLAKAAAAIAISIRTVIAKAGILSC